LRAFETIDVGNIKRLDILERTLLLV